MYGLNEKEIEYLRKCSSDIKSAIDKNNLLMVQLEIGTYLTSEDRMYYDSDVKTGILKREDMYSRYMTRY